MQRPRGRAQAQAGVLEAQARWHGRSELWPVPRSGQGGEAGREAVTPMQTGSLSEGPIPEVAEDDGIPGGPGGVRVRCVRRGPSGAAVEGGTRGGRPFRSSLPSPGSLGSELPGPSRWPGGCGRGPSAPTVGCGGRRCPSGGDRSAPRLSPHSHPREAPVPRWTCVSNSGDRLELADIKDWVGRGRGCPGAGVLILF